jgi:hypothetical protein
MEPSLITPTPRRSTTPEKETIRGQSSQTVEAIGHHRLAVSVIGDQL